MTNYNLALTPSAGSPVSIPMFGIGGVSIARWNVTTLDFGAIVQTGADTKTLSATVYNDGNMAGNFDLDLRGEVRSSSCGMVAAGDSCIVNFIYQPVEGRTYYNAGVFPPNATSKENTLELRGQGVQPTFNLALSMYYVYLYGAPIGATGTETVLLTNLGNVALTLPENIGTATAPFGVTDNCPTSLAPNEYCELSISYSPQDTEYYTGQVRLELGLFGSEQIEVEGVAQW